MQDMLFFAAGTIAALWFLVHIFLGGRDIAGPLLASTELHPVVRDVNYICWHFVSVGIAGMAGFFLWAGYVGDTSLAMAGTLMAAGFTLTGVAIAFKQGANHLAVPQGWLFLPIAALGIAGLLT